MGGPQDGTPSKPPTDIRRILKVFNIVNDERRPKVNLKFAGTLVALVAVGAVLVTFSALNPPSAPPEAPAQERTEYVGLTPTEVALYGSDIDLIQARYAAWQGEHPEAEIVEVEPHRDAQGRWTGYDITYRE